jgi:hypothetical protein
MKAYNKNDNDDVRVNTVGYYNQPDILKQVIVFNNQAAMKTYAKNAKANSDLWDATTELRASWTESGTIYNGVSSALNEEVWPAATYSVRKIDKYAFGPPVHGKMNLYESDPDVLGPIVLNRVYESSMEREEQETLIENLLEYL